MVALRRIEFFGGLRIIRGDSTISRFRTQKTTALLALLAYHRRAHPGDAMVDMLWPRGNSAAGRQCLIRAICSLRHQLELLEVVAGRVLVADRASVQLNPKAVTTDVSEFEAALSAVRQAPDSAAGEMQLEEALRLYRVELLPELYEPWIESGASATLSCCDVFGNAGGDRTGCIADKLSVNGNLSADPLIATFDAASRVNVHSSKGDHHVDS